MAPYILEFTHTSQRPEQVLVLALIGYNKVTLWCHEFKLQYLVSRETISRGQMRVAASSNISAHAHCRPSASNYDSVDTSEVPLDTVHVGTSTHSDGASIDHNITACGLEAVVCLGAIHVVRPDGERVGCIGPSDVVVAAGLDIETDIVLLG